MNAHAKLRKLVNSADNSCSVFTPTPLQVARTYNILNKCIFNGKLKKPNIIIKPLEEIWALCEGDIYTGDDRFENDPVCHRIILHPQFPTRKFFIEVLAHEMVHQYQCEYLNRMDHGQTFWEWEEKLGKYNLRLFLAKNS
jgi:hypothetical protein